jgi:hypothetical protein
MNSTAPRNLPRYLPTLTEVVQSPAAGLQPVGLDVEARVESIVRRTMQLLEPLLHQEIEQAVRRAVQESMAAQAPSVGAN